MIETQTELCIHCGQPASGTTQPAFCCSGCRVAYDLIHGWGLDDYYALRDGRGSLSISGKTQQDSRYEAFNNDAFLGRSAPTVAADGLMSAEFAVHGLHCAACAWLIENAATRTAGWSMARVKLANHTIRIMFDPQLVRLSQIARLLGNLGYELAPLTSEPEAHTERESRRMLVQIAIAGFCAANAMWIAIALYAGDASGVAANHRNFLRIFGTGLGIAAVIFPGRTFFTGAIASLRTRTPHMDLPVALGLSVGTVVGTVHTIIGRGDIYFDSLAVLVFLLLIGRWIQFRQQHRAAKSVDLMLRITPRHANLKTGPGKYNLVLVDSLQPGDVVRVAAGESVPADGFVCRGRSLIDRSLLTGESQPVTVVCDDQVSAGTVNLQQSIEMRVAAVGDQSRIGQVMKSVEEAMTEKTPVVQLADRVGGVFVVVVTLLAVVTFLAWFSRGPSVAAANATSLLIVACPCALALATPLAVAVSLGRAANKRILIRDGGALQLLAKPGRIWFDKTGTLTEGRMIAQYVLGSRDAIRHAAKIEKDCSHPIAGAIVKLAGTSVSETAIEPTKVELGGVSGRSEGFRVAVGNLAFIKRRNILVENRFVQAVESSLAGGSTPILIAIDDRVVTVLRVSDPLKPDAASTLSDLKKLGWQVGILSGDHPEIVARVASHVGIGTEQAFGDLSPEQKLQIVRSRDGNSVVMVGDGANDAAALAAADVGIAVRGGAEVSLQAAPVFVCSGKLAGITDLIAGSRRTMWLIGTAFAVSLGYNVIAVGLAISGQITPLVAALLMPISSVSVLSLTLAWPTFAESES